MTTKIIKIKTMFKKYAKICKNENHNHIDGRKCKPVVYDANLLQGKKMPLDKLAQQIKVR